MMRTLLTLVGSLCLVLCLVSAPAYADIIGAASGHGWPNEARGCFQDRRSRMDNDGPSGPICSEAVLIIPLSFRSVSISATTVISVRAEGSAELGLPTTCVGVADDPNTAVRRSTPRGSAGPEGLRWIQLAPLTVSAGWTVAVECQVPVGGTVVSVEWTR